MFLKTAVKVNFSNVRSIKYYLILALPTCIMWTVTNHHWPLCHMLTCRPRTNVQWYITPIWLCHSALWARAGLCAEVGSPSEGHTASDECAVRQATLTTSATARPHQQNTKVRLYCPLEMEYISLTHTSYCEYKLCIREVRREGLKRHRGKNVAYVEYKCETKYQEIYFWQY